MKFINYLSLLLLCTVSFTSAADVEKWDCFELVLKSDKSYSNPFTDVTLSAVFENGDKRFDIQGFYDGDNVYIIRFMPNQTGKWSYETKSNNADLSGKKGTFNCIKSSNDNHGPIRVYKKYYLAYEDGTPYFQIGTTCYAWTHQGDKMEEQTLKSLSKSPFNKIRMCVFPKSYTYNKNEPPEYAFERNAKRKQDFSRFNPKFFQRFEKRILDLQKLGIEADVIVFHPYDRWGYKSMSAKTDDFYLRYLTARISAYRNVWWSLANEYDFMRAKKESDWDRFFKIIRDNDPYHHLRGIHNGRKWYDHNKPWVTHASLQTTKFNEGISYREKYQKPVIYDECRYEGDVPQGWGNLTPMQMMRNFWLGTMQGCYVGHGETYKDPKDILWWSKGGVLKGKSPERIQFLKDFMKSAPPFDELQPIGNNGKSYILTKPGEYYLVYFPNTQTITLDLQGKQPYKIDGIDPWEMKINPIGTANAGKYSLSSPKADYLYRLTPYAPGEKIRPEAKASADKTSGSAPLTVKFSAVGNLKFHWDFGDGSTSNQAKPSHTYKEMGHYIVTMTATNNDGVSASSSLSIGVLPSAPKDLDTFKAWPGSQSGLIFKWENNNNKNEITDAKGKIIRKCTIKQRNKARFGKRGEMDLANGEFMAEDINQELLEACKRTNQFSLEAVITPENLKQKGPARCITFSKDSLLRNFTLGQESNKLVLRLRTTHTGKNAMAPQVPFCTIKAKETTHVLVSYFSGNLYCYVNGKTVFNSGIIQGDLSNWEPCYLLFGDEFSGDRKWKGQIEAVSIYNRFIGPEEASRKFALFNGN